MTASTTDRAGVRVLHRRIEVNAEAIGRRLLQDAFTEALANQWRRRAATFEWAMHRPGDFAGRATPADLAARNERLANLARLSREHARLIEEANGAEMAAELADLLASEGAVA